MIYTDTLKKNYEFKNVLSRGQFYSGKFVNIYIRKNHKNINYIGIAVGVKMAKAVKRNRVKRLIRENYRLLENKIETGNNIVFLWKNKNNIKEATFWNIKKDMLLIFERANLIK